MTAAHDDDASWRLTVPNALSVYSNQSMGTSSDDLDMIRELPQERPTVQF